MVVRDGENWDCCIVPVRQRKQTLEGIVGSKAERVLKFSNTLIGTEEEDLKETKMWEKRPLNVAETGFS
ncbi:hypothetical protein VNO80_16231 [Phaseolus coccineus]|uniref:Uncharacterized protein n=1 Tax=Phaseolus coccineus TaxID=3886 RepID=A0AAN9MLQ1_PHACN